MAGIDSTATQAPTKPAVPVVTSFPFNPLTTTFTRPSDCDGIFASSFLSGIDFSTTCLPKGFHTDEISYFSPGLVCPTGYYSACHDNIGAKSITTVTCCPTFGTDLSLSCVTASTLASVWSTLFCTWVAGDVTSLPMTVSDNGITSTVTRSFSGREGLNAFGVRMVYQKTDTQRTTMATTTKHTATEYTPTSWTWSGWPAYPTGPESSDSSGGLSSGAKAAIGVGIAVPIVVVGLAVGLFVWWWRRRKQYNKVLMGQQTQPTELHNQSTPSELVGTMGKPMHAAEVPAHEPPATELPASWR
ncbi:uncharacterized protein Triagg1_1298 [Trichoderma aggressivum f. europaeum]|uniref:Uncharacterized protein n=1 Tax=Trichoderma aggressivum f. europaeum TaxID=173218 RepID=A0AAE1IIJ8_9HYPO|nr:hypothetical protein Triagg1_1298 [Trichoderma aggressivum f. europaeum]